MGWFRRETIPVDVREQLRLEPRERVLVGAGSGSGWVVATTLALWLPGRSVPERIGWERVDSASWDRDESTLRVVEAGRPGERPRRWALRLEDARDLLLVIKERVQASVVTSQWVPVADGRGVTVVARRPPGSDRLVWSVSLDRGVDLGDSGVKSKVDEAVRRLRLELGG
jgi:hypothetical protein